MNTVRVEATEERFRVLMHMPGRIKLDPETGRGTWPADSFTYRLEAEGSIRIIPDETPSAPAKKEK